MKKSASENTVAENTSEHKKLYICPSCGYMFPLTMANCPVCGADSKGAPTAPSRLVEPHRINVKPRPDIPKDSVIMSILGRGMMPYVDDGQSVYIKRTEHIEVGDIGVLFLDDDRMVIRYLSEDGLCSLSPQWEAFHVDPHAHYEVWGKVVGVVQPGDILEDKVSENSDDKVKAQAENNLDIAADTPKLNTAPPRRRRRKSSKSSILYCGFCGKSQDDVDKLIVADKSTSVCICNECARLCNKILDKEMGVTATEE